MTSPRSPQLLKGALVAADPLNPAAGVVVFQYNPETLSRRLEAQSVGGDGGAPGDALRLTGPPKETISLTVMIDASDQLETAERSATEMGIYPTLSALELMLYPKTASVLTNSLLAKAGNIEIIPPEAPPTFFVWGLKRLLPVRVSGMTITEQSYDPGLNPIRAQVELSLQVLNHQDFTPEQAGFGIFIAHQVAKETMAVSNTFTNAPNLANTLSNIL